ncbi:phosphoglycerate dehydrogenase [Sedimentisphaera salicampi]|uniref:D-3-phosphoglycerate dehydrogenase n=1 Tax=Sedimentisphaera salicampi TaxID=1941349 RepID=A0A1W6LJZ6_9BACT|nr:phosphoglycerate dehydrogenase [Sedimentisphaera salicampi]ARN56063.1 D-3-phosphoglycerate dehydrogenase [Sedimentisphaera salicampi]OXU15795.1 D-3-phosphoglycerate dehydrogenase [Sedimentisphaera salicampi]
MYKILIADKLAQQGIDLINATEGFEAVVKTGISEEELSSIIGDYDGLIVRSATQVTEKVLENTGNLKGVARAGVGVDNINIPEATRKGVLVMNTPGGNTLSAAEHTMALMLALSRNVVPACNKMKSGGWDRKLYVGNQLNNKVLGVIGLGRIGMAVIRMASGFNMKIMGYDPFSIPTQAENFGVQITDSLEEIYKNADYLTMHIPRNKNTENLISKEQLEMMKPTARIVNCARGGIINEDDLYDALENNVIAGAALDVYNEEPPENRRFEKLENSLVTPHLGASTEEAQIGVAVEAAEVLMDSIKGGPIKNAINAPAVSESAPKIIKSYSELAQKVGRLMNVLKAGRIKKVVLEYRGTIANEDVTPLKTSFSIGLLQQNFDVQVNIVNAGFLARERGISIDEVKNEDCTNFSSCFTAKVSTEIGDYSVTGTLFDDNIMKIVSINGYETEFTPSGLIMLALYKDRPGVIGSIGTACGKYQINIGTMSVGRKGGKAMMALSLDQNLGKEAQKALDEVESVEKYTVCDFE